MSCLDEFYDHQRDPRMANANNDQQCAARAFANMNRCNLLKDPMVSYDDRSTSVTISIDEATLNNVGVSFYTPLSSHYVAYGVDRFIISTSDCSAPANDSFTYAVNKSVNDALNSASMSNMEIYHYKYNLASLDPYTGFQNKLKYATSCVTFC